MTPAPATQTRSIMRPREMVFYRRRRTGDEFRHARAARLPASPRTKCAAFRPTGSCYGELALQVVEIRLRIDCSSHRALERLDGRELASVAMHVLAQPFANLAEFAACDLTVHVVDVLAQLLPDL